MPTLTKLYTRQEVNQHCTKDDCWIVLDGKVYDVSTYMDDHPGGDDVILETAGKDGSDDFEDAGHSKDARDQLESFCIGEIDPDSAIPQTETQPIGKSQKLMDLTKQYWVVPAAVVGISVVVGLLYLRKK